MSAAITFQKKEIKEMPAYNYWLVPQVTSTQHT